MMEQPMPIGVVRAIDGIGRVTLPAPFRRTMRIEPGEQVEMILTAAGILIRRWEGPRAVDMDALRTRPAE